MVTREGGEVRSGPEAAEVAGVTYRMLDHWHRQGWVTATCTERVGASRVVRRYDDLAVLRLGAMRHLAMSGMDVARYGADVGGADLNAPVMMVVGGQPDAVLELIAVTDLQRVVSQPGRWVVFDPAPLKAKLARVPLDDQVDIDENDATPAVALARRSA